jgi:hypothetical protein
MDVNKTARLLYTSKVQRRQIIKHMRGIYPRCLSTVTDRYIAAVNIFRYQIRQSSKNVQDFTETEFLLYYYLQTYERACNLNYVYQRLYGWYARERPLKDPLIRPLWVACWVPTLVGALVTGLGLGSVDPFELRKPRQK